MANPFNEDGSLTCDICGKGLWGGPLGHTTEEDWRDCNIKLQKELARQKTLKRLAYGRAARKHLELLAVRAQRQMDEFFLKRGSQ